jgi:ankyrin repeat protein
MKSPLDGKVKNVKTILKQISDFKIIISLENTILEIVFASIDRNDLEIFKVLVQNLEVLFFINKTHLQTTPLLYAMAKQKLEIAKFLANHSAVDVNKIHPLTKLSPIFLAQDSNQKEIFETLIKRGAEISHDCWLNFGLETILKLVPNVSNMKTNTAMEIIFTSMERNDIEMLTLFMEKPGARCHINKIHPTLKTTSLIYALEAKNFEAALFLAIHPAVDVNQLHPNSDISPVMLAKINGQKEIFETLRIRGAKLGIKAEKDRKIFINEISNGDYEEIETMLKLIPEDKIIPHSNTKVFDIDMI